MFSPTRIPDPVQFTAPTQESLYLIVAFDEGSTGPVAREWFTGKYDGGMAWWPPFKDSYKILQSILKRTIPNPFKGWKRYSCRIIHETNCFESLSKRWGLSCHTSDLNTDKEELPVVRQRRKPSRLLSPPSSPASCLSSDNQNAPAKKKKKKTTSKASKTNPPPPPLLPMAGNNITAVTNKEQPSPAHPSLQQRSKPMSVGRKLAYPATPCLTPPAHPTSSCSEETAVNIEEEATGLEYWMADGFSDLTPENNEGLCAFQQPPCHTVSELLQRTNDVPQDDCQKESPIDEGMCSPELSVNTSMPQCREAPLSRPGLPHRTPESQRFARSAPAGCTAVERLLLEQVGELQLKMDYVIKLLQRNNAVPHEDFNLNMLPLLTLQDLDDFDEHLRTDGAFKK